MPTNRNAANMICPYYIYDGGMSITCEGIIKGARTMTKFQSVERKQRFVQMCCQQYQYNDVCPIARLLTDMYDGGER